MVGLSLVATNASAAHQHHVRRHAATRAAGGGVGGGVSSAALVDRRPAASLRSSEFVRGGFERMTLVGPTARHRRTRDAAAAASPSLGNGTVCMAPPRGGGGKEEARADPQGKKAVKAKPYKAPAKKQKKYKESEWSIPGSEGGGGKGSAKGSGGGGGGPTIDDKNKHLYFDEALIVVQGGQGGEGEAWQGAKGKVVKNFKYHPGKQQKKFIELAAAEPADGGTEDDNTTF